MGEGESDSRNWFLRIASGVVFGPVPTKALRIWAEQGRVQPGNEISLDRKNWIPAPSLEELDIVWYLEDNMGNLTGPFNKRAAEKLIADGRVGEGTSIVHKDDADLAHLVRPAMENRRRKPLDGAPELDFGEGDGAAESDENTLRTECEGLRLRVEVLEKSQKQLLAAAEKECKSHERQLEAERKKVSRLEAELEEAKLLASTAANAAAAEAENARKNEPAVKTAQLEAELAKVTDKATKLEAELAEVTDKATKLEAERAEVTDKATKLEAELAKVTDKATKLEAELAKVTDKATKLESELAEATDKITGLRAELAEVTERATKREAELAEVTDKATKLEAELAEATDKIAKLDTLQADYNELLSFSNDRDAEAQKRVAELEADLEKGKAASAGLERRCADLEKKNAELTAAQEQSMRPPTTVPEEADRLFAAQIEYLSSLLADGQKRQKLIQGRIDELVALRSNGLADAAERQARMKAERDALERSREEINNLRLENTRNAQLAESREQELQRRIRILEIDLNQTKDSAREADALRQRIQQLTDAVNDRDQLIVRERKERAEEHQQLEQAQKALLESTQKAEDADGGQPEQEPPPPQPAKRRFHATPWMSFKK